MAASHPTRGAWIEILCDVSKLDTKEGSHPTRGAWIEMLVVLMMAEPTGCRTPHGVRGLKF